MSGRNRTTLKARCQAFKQEISEDYRIMLEHYNGDEVRARQCLEMSLRGRVQGEAIRAGRDAIRKTATI